MPYIIFIMFQFQFQFPFLFFHFLLKIESACWPYLTLSYCNVSLVSISNKNYGYCICGFVLGLC